MPKVTSVKSARNDYPDQGIKKGESYYWWAFMQGGRGGPKIRSKTYPKQSQLTQSAFWSAVYSVGEDHDTIPSNVDDMDAEIDAIKDDLQNILDETQEKYDNLPDGLQQGQSGEQLQGRVDAIESAISDLDSVDCSFEKDEESEDSEEDQEAARMEEIWSEVRDAIDGISCD